MTLPGHCAVSADPSRSMPWPAISQNSSWIGIHVGIPWVEEMIAMAWKHPNVYIGCDAHSPRYWPQSFVHFINSYGQDKVLFGTDYPVLDFERTRREIESLGLKDSVLVKLLRENARRLYRLL